MTNWKTGSAIFEHGGDRETWIISPEWQQRNRACNLPLDLIGLLQPDLWRTWAVLRTYVGAKGYAYPRRLTLAENMGLSRLATVTDRVARLEAQTYVKAEARNIGSNVYRVWPF